MENLYKPASLSNCPFCDTECYSQDNFIRNDNTAVRCGCITNRCRGSIYDSPHYVSVENMRKEWNRRDKK